MSVAIAALWLAVPPRLAPRINVRWAADVGALERSELEQRFALAAGELREGTTWAYDLVDATQANVHALIAERAVDDTAFLDRPAGLVTNDAPSGSTVANPGVLTWLREVTTTRWWLAATAAVASVLSGIWLWLDRRSQRFRTTSLPS